MAVDPKLAVLEKRLLDLEKRIFGDSDKDSDYPKICVDDDGKREWILYDVGSKSVECPLICLPPVSGRADVFFKQMLSLSALGFRVISVEYPTYWNCKEFCNGFKKLLDHLQLSKVHLFGASLGGFLAQKFAESVEKKSVVHSLILCNAFTDTSVFEQTIAAPTFWMLPGLVLKMMLLNNFEKKNADREIADSVDFFVDSLESLKQKDLASRLALNCRDAHVDTKRLANIPITIMDVNDECALSESVKDVLYQSYPNARRAHLKTGGNFPYLSRADEVNVYLQIHLREFDNTPYSAIEMAETDIDAVPVVNSDARGTNAVASAAS